MLRYCKWRIALSKYSEMSARMSLTLDVSQVLMVDLDVGSVFHRQVLDHIKSRSALL